MVTRRSVLGRALLAGVPLAGLDLIGREARAAGPKTYVYLHAGRSNPDGSEIYAFRIKGSNFELRPVSGMPFVDGNRNNCGGDCQTAAVSTARMMLFTTGLLGITAWSIQQDGSLVQVAGSPFGGRSMAGVGVIEQGQRTFVYACDIQDAFSGVHGYEVQPDGSLVALMGSPFASGSSHPVGMTVGGGKVFVVHQANPSPVTCFLPSANGTLALGVNSPFEVPGAGNFHAYATPDGMAIYYPDCDATQPFGVHAVGVDPVTGAMSVLPGSPYPFSIDNTCGPVAVCAKGLIAFSSTFQSQGEAYKIRGDYTLKPLGTTRRVAFTEVQLAAITPEEDCLVAYGRRSQVQQNRIRTFAYDPKRGSLQKSDLADLDTEFATALAFAQV